MRIQLFGAGQQSKSPFVSAKRLINMYCETRPGGEKSGMVAYRTPGLSSFINFATSSPPRGAMEMEKTDIAYCVVGATFYEVLGNATFTPRGTLSTTAGRVSMANNGTQVMVTDGVFGYIYDTGTLVFSKITDPDFPANPTSCAFLLGRFIASFSQSSRFYISDSYNGLSWDALNFANAESSSDPILLVWASNGQLILFGTRTTEFWGASGAVDFAFSNIGGSSTEWGISAPWSVAKFDNTCVGLFRNRMGQVMVAKLAGYLPQKISTPDLDNIINGYSVVSDASGYSYMLGGHPMYVLNFPTASRSWLYDGSTGIWSELKTYGYTRHISEFGISFLNMTIVASYSSGKLYTLTNTVKTDDGLPIESHVVTQTLASKDDDRITLGNLRVDMQTGQGGSVEYPQVGLTISRDNGNTWGAEMMRGIGPIGEYAKYAEWTRLGSARSFVFDFRVSDPVDFTLISASVNTVD